MDATSSVSSKRLSGKVGIITGGASGIGASSVKAFHEEGAIVVVADIQDDLGKALVDQIGGDNISYIHCDVSNEDDMKNLIDTTISKYGKLDIMFNNAGILDNGAGTILNTSKSDLERLIGVNLVGSFLGAQYAAKVMIPKGKGCILFTASACTAISGIGPPTYAATKYGVLGLTKSLAAELGQYGIRVNCVSPYGVATPMAGVTNPEYAEQLETNFSLCGNLKGQVLKPEGVAQAALYLASDDASYVSGLNLVVDGGYSVVNHSLIHGMNHVA